MQFAERVGQQVSRIESEMRNAGLWQSEPLRPEQYEFSQAFAMDTMSFAQWLQFVFLERVKEAISENAFPSRSMVAAQAVREFDGVHEASSLVTALADFDAMIEGRA